MRTCKVMLNTAADVTEFVRLVSGCAHEIGLANGRYLVNAKSIMGIFSLDLSKPIDLNIHAESNLDTILTTLAPYMVE